MKLAELISRSGLESRVLGTIPDTEVISVEVDSRKAGPGVLFVAQRGSKADGNQFADAALAAGAVAVLTDDSQAAKEPGRLLVASTALATGMLLRELHGRPDAEMKCFGVTGTNGKTSSAFLAEAMFREAGLAPALFSTVLNRWPGHQDDSSMTTPAAVDLWRQLQDARDAGARSLAMEVSSHALHQERVAGLYFDAAVFTNLTRDHLDYHGDFGSYFAAKSRLFTRHLKPDAISVVNLDDPYGQLLRRQLTGRVSGFSFDDAADADYHIHDLSLSLTGMSFRLEGKDGALDLRSPLLGRVYAQNLAGAAIAALGMGIPADAIVRASSEVVVPGRCQLVSVSGCTGIVDYAHTPDALERLLTGLRPLVTGRLVCVFGCGGDRDRGKRPQMGGIAARLADRAIATSDNPRTEDPAAIVDEVLAGAPQGSCERVVDRHEAIRAAAVGLRPGDLLVVAGKGHEKTQTVGTEKHHFDDVEEVRAALEGI